MLCAHRVFSYSTVGYLKSRIFYFLEFAIYLPQFEKNNNIIMELITQRYLFILKFRKEITFFYLNTLQHRVIFNTIFIGSLKDYNSIKQTENRRTWYYRSGTFRPLSKGCVPLLKDDCNFL